MELEFEISAILPASAKQLYDAWLDSKQHAAMTGGEAQVSDQVGGHFSAWDGYISGHNMSLEPGKRIVQAWRTVEFTANEPDSRLEIIFEAHDQGTQVTVRHSQLPAHGMQYKQGWVDNYFAPIQRYFQP